MWQKGKNVMNGLGAWAEGRFFVVRGRYTPQNASDKKPNSGFLLKVLLNKLPVAPAG